MKSFSGDIAIDLGTANTLIWMKNQEVVLNEPSIVARDKLTNKIIAVGNEAKAMLGRTHSGIETIRPLKDGVIADFQSSEQMIRGFIKMIPRKKSIFSPSLKILLTCASSQYYD